MFNRVGLILMLNLIRSNSVYMQENVADVFPYPEIFVPKE
jgi:hypothetical protein